MVEPVVIPEAAVEAAAKRLANIGGQPNNWANYRTPARASLEAAAPHMHEPTRGDVVTVERAIEQIGAGEQTVPSNYMVNTGLSDAVLWNEVREWLESLAGDSK